MQQTSETKNTGIRKKKGHVFRKILVVLLVLTLLLTGGFFLAYSYVTKDYENVTFSHAADTTALMQSKDVTNILLMGIDTADGSEDTRSDSMILLSVDRKHNRLKLTSFMRDMYVEIPGHGYTKLGHACFYAGAPLTIDTIELNFNVRIDAYVKIGYDIFRTLVNSMDGITVPEIDEVESAALAREGVQIAPGKNIHLNGDEALQYCRIRKGQTDFQRTSRQREMLTLLAKKAKTLSPFKLVSLAKEILAEVESSIPKKDLIPLALHALPCLGKDIGQQQIPADGTWWDETIDGLMVLRVHFDENIEAIRQFIYE